MSDEPLKLQFGPPQFTIKALPLPKKTGQVTFELPDSSNLLRVEAPEHSETALLWVMLPVGEAETRMVPWDLMVVYDNETFSVEETPMGPALLEDGTFIEAIMLPHVFMLGSWTDKVVAEDGTVTFRTAHVLELVSNDGEEEPEDGSCCG